MVLAGCASERARPDSGVASGVHPSGILDATSGDFHAKELARRGWDLGLCAGCHGADFRGGTAKLSCVACHPSGPDACVTCHGDGPTTGAHLVHQREGQACAECHVVPARWDARGHVLGDLEPAEVTFGARAQATLDPADRTGPPTYIARGAGGPTCANVYCHGDVLHAGGGLATQPRWDDATLGGCDRCHGAPPPSHTQSACDSCHRGARHLDGVVQIGGGCTGCHGDVTSPAPPMDLAGNTVTTAVGVGAHRAHLDAPSRLSAPIACTECHRVPATLGEAGHLDSALPAEVFPPGSGMLARAAGAVPAWDHAAATCAGAYCHGATLADTAAGRLTEPAWIASSGQVYCGSCHGIPPTTPAHAPSMSLGDCVTCHPRTVDGFGNILLGGTPSAITSEHLDGAVDGF